MQTSKTVPDTGFMRIGQVLALIPIGRSTWWAWVRDGRAPAAVRLAPRTTAWRSEDVRRLIEQLGAGGRAVKRGSHGR